MPRVVLPKTPTLIREIAINAYNKNTIGELGESERRETHLIQGY